MSHRSLTALTVLILLPLLYGCGRKTPLVPPQKLVPVAINDLHYTLDEKGVTLKWSYPAKMENGDKLQAVESFEVFRAAVPEDEFCQGCPIEFEEPVEIDGGRLPTSGELKTASYTEGYLQSGFHYFYALRNFRTPAEMYTDMRAKYFTTYVILLAILVLFCVIPPVEPLTPSTAAFGAKGTPPPTHAGGTEPGTRSTAMPQEW